MKKNILKVVMYLNHPQETDKINACTVYRNFTPMKFAEDVSIMYVSSVETQIEFNPIKKKITNIKMDAEPIEWADVVVFSRHYDQPAIMGCLVEVAKQMGKLIVYETDDLLQKVEQNIGKHAYDPNGMKKQLEFVNWLIPEADLVTVTTPYLANFYKNEMKAKETAVLPNYYDPQRWKYLYAYKKLRDFWRKKILRRKTIRIGWQGGNNHFLKNFNYLVEPLNELHKKYGTKFEFVVFSGNDPRVDLFAGDKDKRKFLEFDFEHRQSVDIFKFPRALAELDLDLGLIVVEDNEFSRGKSNIKWMEYSLLGIPSIASRCEPYLSTNSLLVDNSKEQWFNALESLLLSEDKRDKMSIEARKMVLGYNIRHHAWKWSKTFREAIARKSKQKVGKNKPTSE